MAGIDAVLKKVLSVVTPTDDEVEMTESVLARIRDATEKAIRPHGIGYTLAGSYLRDTWLPSKKEFDIFMLFPEHVSRAALEKNGLEIGREIVRSLGGKFEIAYAEHPYIRAEVGGYAVDFVPCYDVRDAGKIKSAVDRTPHHNKYILENLSPGLSSQVRILKQFCRGIGVYGSDLCVEGFSGYLTELLVINYGGFEALARDASRWVAGNVVIDLKKHHKGKLDTERMFPSQPLVVIDPVDRKRNVAAALSPGNFEKFRASCAAFVKSPDMSFFNPERPAMAAGAVKNAFSMRGTLPVSVIFRRPDVVDDVLYPQMRRTVRRLSALLEDSDFRVIGKGVWSDGKECALFMELEVWELPSVRKVVGPSVFAGKNSRDFVRKYSGNGRLLVEGEAWVAEVNRKHTAAVPMLEKTLEKGKKRLRDMGVASYAAGSISKDFRMLSGDGVSRKARSSPGFAQFLAQYLKDSVL